MTWEKFIHTDPKVLLGKPVIRGTRLFAEGWTEQQILENYPTLTHESLRAVFAFAAECMRDETMCAIASQGRR